MHIVTDKQTDRQTDRRQYHVSSWLAKIKFVTVCE